MVSILEPPRSDDALSPSSSSASSGAAEVRPTTPGSSTVSRTDEPPVKKASSTSPLLVPPGQRTSRRVGGGMMHLQPILPAPLLTSRLLAPLTVAPLTVTLPAATGGAAAALAVAAATANGRTVRREFGPPAVFRNRQQRCGKWIREEEAYADALIRLFERGMLYDCENGSTLRSYLSRKLHCAPMRISKKYAGQGIGKTLFVCRVQLNLSVLAPCPAEIKLLEQQAKKTELLFYKKVFPDMDLPDEIPPSSPPRAPPVSLQGNVPVPALVPIPFPVLLHSQAPPVPIKPISMVQGAISATHHGHIRMTPMSFEQPLSCKDALQRSFMNAMHQANGNTIDPKNMSATNAHGYHSQQVHAPTLGPQSVFRSNAIVTSVPVPGPANVPNMLLLNGALPSMSAPMAQLVLTPVPAPALPSPPPTARLNEPGDSTAANHELSPVPDFLAGFDRVALAMRASGPRSADPHPSDPGPEESFQYSPPFTSQSFDDLHCFLGEDLVPLEPAVEAADPPGSHVTTTAPLHHEYAPVCVLPEGSARHVTQCQPLSSVAPSYPHGLVPQAQETDRLPVAARDDASDDHILIDGDSGSSFHGSMTSMDHAYGDYDTALVSDENNDSGQSSANRSCSEPDNAASSREQSDDDDDDDFDNLDWESSRARKKMRLDHDHRTKLRS